MSTDPRELTTRISGHKLDCNQSDNLRYAVPTQAARLRFAHTSMMVDDLALAAGFITDALGFKAAFGPVEIGAELTALTGTPCGQTLLMQFTHPKDGVTVELLSSANVAGAARPPLAHIAFIVPALDAAIANACAAGAVQLGQITAFSEGRAVYLRAPGGLVIEIEELFP